MRLEGGRTIGGHWEGVDMRTIRILSSIAVVGLVACSSGTVITTTGGKASDTTGSQGTTDDTSATDPSQTGDPTDPASPSPPLVEGLAISSVAVFQGVKVDVVKDGEAVTKRNAPVVANRPGLLRVYVTPSSGYSEREVTAELRLVDGSTRLPILKDTKVITRASSDADLDSTFNFELPAASLAVGITYQVFLTAKDGAVANGTNGARFPQDGGVASLEVEPSGKLKIVVVPVKYEADGSGRVPDTSAAQLERYKKTFMSRYPATEVEITARQPFSWTTAIAPNGSGFSQVLNAITQLRRSDGAAADVYYYGALAPAASFSSFCQRGCVTGLSTVVENPKTSFLRASVGVGYPGEDATNTAAHEIGHAHGRSHAPCGGAQGVDPDYPYAQGSIGVWGYDILGKTLMSPTKGKDMMGYCPNEWVSDYTFTALFDRIAAVNGHNATSATGSTADGVGASAAAAMHGRQTYRMAVVAADGSIESASDIELDEEPAGGELRAATFVSATGQTLGQRAAQFFPYDHLPGGVLVVPQAGTDATLGSWSSVRVRGVRAALTR